MSTWLASRHHSLCQSLVALLLIGATSVASAQQEERAKEMLFRSIRGDFRANLVAILRQRDPKDEDEDIKFKVVRSKSGKTRNAVIAPLRLQGKETVDDGIKSYTFLPDDKVMVVQPSANIKQDSDFRIPLISKNYTLSARKGEKIAGRSTLLVTATPRESKLGGMRYWLDEMSAFVLRREVYDHSEEEWLLDYEVIQADFPAQIDESVFKIKPIGGYETLEYGPRGNVANVKEAEKVLGFLPIMPKDIPFRFQIQSMQTNTQTSWKSLSMKLTDGLQKVTVYQWKPGSKESIRAGSDSSIQTVNGIRFMVVSDISPNVRNSILRSFIKYASNQAYTAQIFTQ